MNHIHRLVWNAARRLWVPAAETVRARGGKSRSARVGAVVMGVCGLGVAGTGWAACTDDPLVGASADGGSVCTTASATYSGGNDVLSASGTGTVLDASGVTQVDATGGGWAISVNSATLILGNATLNFDGHEEGIQLKEGSNLSSKGKLAINVNAYDSWWPGALHINSGSTAELSDISISITTTGNAAGNSEPADGIGIWNGKLIINGAAKIDMSGARHNLNPALAINRSGSEAIFNGPVDFTGPDTTVSLRHLNDTGEQSTFSATGGGKIHGGTAALNLVGGAPYSIVLTNVDLTSPINAIAAGCIAYATGCSKSSATKGSINISGGNINAKNVLYTDANTSINLTAEGNSKLNGNVVAFLTSSQGPANNRMHLHSGATLTGTILGGFSNHSIYYYGFGRADLELDLGATSEAGGKWVLTNSSNLKTMRNGLGGAIDFGQLQYFYKTLTVANYIGGGDITFNTFLGDSSSPSDKLIIDGGSATGSSRVWVRNTGGLGAMTTGNGILLVEAINGGTTAPSAFALGQAVIAGAYDYSLQRAGENWYLSSGVADTPAPPPPPPAPAPSPSPSPSPAPSPAPAPTPTPAPEPNPAPAPSPAGSPAALAPAPATAPVPSPAPAPVQNYRAESSLYAALPSQALTGMGQALELPTTPPPPPVAVKVAAADTTSALTALSEREQALQEPGTWARLVGTQARNKAEGQSANGAHWAQFKANTELLQAGRRVAQSTDGAAQQAWSVFGALGTVSGDVTHTNALGQSSVAGSNKVEIASLGAALSQRFDAETYLEAAALLSHLRATSASVRGLGFKTSGTGFAATVEAGQRLNLRPGWGWQPHATLRVAQASLGDTQDEAGQVRFGDARSAQAGLGVTLHTTGESATQFSATARLLHEFAGRPGTVLADASGHNGQTFHSSTRGTAVQIKAGVEHRVAQSGKLFATLNHTRGLNAGNSGSSDTGVSLGAKFGW